MKAYIKDLDVFLPENTLDNNEIANNVPNWSAQKIHDKVGIDSRHIASEDETSLVLAYKACEKLFRHDEHYVQQIDCILYSTLIHEHFMLHSAAVLQRRLGISCNCGCFDFKLPCSGYLNLLFLAKGLVEAGLSRNVLVVTADTYSKKIPKRDFSTRTLFGDAATATIISNCGAYSIENVLLGADGIGSENHMARVNCVPWLPQHDVALVNNDPRTYSANEFYMNGGEIFEFTFRKIPSFYVDFLSRCSLTVNQVTLHIFHQANAYMLEHLRRQLSIPKERFLIDMLHTGNTSTSSIAICLQHLNMLTCSADTIGLCSFGGGYSWGAALLKRTVK